MPSEHGDMSPSSLLRKQLCPGSYYAELNAPAEIQSVEAEEGTDLHGLVSDYGTNKLTEQQVIEAAGDKAHAVAFCLEVISAVKALHPNPHVWFERPLDHTAIHPSVGKGTADFLVVNPWKSGSIVDWKFGHGEVPPARFNIQLGSYACAAAREFDLDTVYVAVVMAAQGWVSEHVYQRDELEAVEARIRAICDAALLPWAPRRPTEEGCKYCRAFSVCPEVLAIAKKANDKMQGNVPEGLPGSVVGSLLSEAEILGVWVNRLKAQATRLLMAGGEVSGWCMKEGRKTRQWADGVTPAQLQEVVRQLGKDADKVLHVEMVSPAELDKVVGASKKVKAALEPLIVKKPGEPKLARATETEEKNAEG